jgi:hypothetical protein
MLSPTVISLKHCGALAAILYKSGLRKPRKKLGETKKGVKGNRIIKLQEVKKERRKNKVFEIT